MAERSRTVLSVISAALWSILLTASFSTRAENSEIHFDGKRYFNPEGGRVGNDVWKVIKWGFTRNPPEWKEIDVEPSRPPKRMEEDSILATWVGHATLLIQWHGLNILTDPIWSDRASPFTWIGPKRYAAPGILFEDLPPIDLVLISHNHYDQLDESTVSRLAERDRPRFFVPLGVASWFTERGIEKVIELDWWESREFQPFEIHCVPAKHFSGRGPFDRNETLWSGWVVKGATGTFYFAGDTGYTKYFRQIGGRFAPIRLAALPIGAYEPRWFMSPVHMNPDEAVQAFLDLGAGHAVGIHFNTFRLTDEPQDEPARRIPQIIREKNLPPDSFWVPLHGESGSYLGSPHF